MIKPSDNVGLDSVVDSVTRKFLIIDTTLRPCKPPKFCKMTPKLRQICGCNLFVITKDMQIDLNRYITKLVSDLQQKSVRRNTHNSAFSTISDAHWKDNVFLDGECFYANIKDAAQCISFNLIKPNNLIHIQCALGLCDGCPK